MRTPADAELAERLLQIAVRVEAMMDRHKPDTVAIERVFSQHNVRTVMGTAQASGVVALAAARRGIPVAWHTPSEVKAAVSGHGNADKAQVTAMITRLLKLPEAPEAGRRRGRPRPGAVSPVAFADAVPDGGRGQRGTRTVGVPGEDDPVIAAPSAARSLPSTWTTRSSRSAASAWPSAPPRPPWPSCAAASRRGCGRPWWCGRTR